MTEALFYHLERTSLEQALPPLLEKCLQRGWRAAVRVGSPERLDLIDEALWTYRDDSFLPHGRDGPEAARQPVLLTLRAHAPNAAQALFLADGAAPFDLHAFARVCPVFDGRDEAALVQARLLWTELKGAGVKLTYCRQSADGGWSREG